MDADLNHVLVEYDPDGSLLTTHASQGSDMGLFGGLLGWETTDERLENYREEINKAGLNIDIEYVSYGAKHPSTYRLTLDNDKETHTLSAVSTGGGMIVIEDIDGAKVHMAGDCFETLLFMGAKNDQLLVELKNEPVFDEVAYHPGEKPFIEIKSRETLSDQTLKKVLDCRAVNEIRVLKPVLPILSSKDLSVPFISVENMLNFNKDGNLQLWELAVEYERARGGISKREVYEKTRKLLGIMEDAVQTGLAGTSYDDRILPSQAPGFRKKMEAGELVKADVLNSIILYVSALMEVKSSMGVIVAAPTAGSCGAMPGAVLGVADSTGLDDDSKIRGLLVAGLIGVFISERATFAAELGGCMAECGSGSGMAAAAIVTMQGGDIAQALSAASVALQNSFGMTCDPIANRVEAPCLGKNIMAATNALSSANMGLAGYEHLVPLDEVIDAMKKVGDQMPRELCCTNLGGLSLTPTAKAIEINARGNAG